MISARQVGGATTRQQRRAMRRRLRSTPTPIVAAMLLERERAAEHGCSVCSGPCDGRAAVECSSDGSTIVCETRCWACRKRDAA